MYEHCLNTFKTIAQCASLKEEQILRHSVRQTHTHTHTRGLFETHKKVFLLAVNVGGADGVVGSVFLSDRFLALKEEKRRHVEADRDMNLGLKASGGEF